MPLILLLFEICRYANEIPKKDAVPALLRIVISQAGSWGLDANLTCLPPVSSVELHQCQRNDNQTGSLPFPFRAVAAVTARPDSD